MEQIMLETAQLIGWVVSKASPVPSPPKKEKKRYLSKISDNTSSSQFKQTQLYL